eukprot:m.27854 g.27854  ORF g.27854 m.27854 type:complete len:380 (-) comp7945_c0_seq1:31-1170(-)
MMFCGLIQCRGMLTLPVVARGLSGLSKGNRRVDLRSDTVTQPTSGMREIMAHAAVGDDVYGEDPTINQLEQRCAEMSGKEAALFVPSGTMGNLVSLASHCSRGDEVILGHGQHIFRYEGGGASSLLGVSLSTIPNKEDGSLELDDIRNAIRADDPHFPVTRLVCLENTHNSCGGRFLRNDFIQAVVDLCTEHGLSSHIDGARVLNASVAAGLTLAELTEGIDSMSICFSKGLGCPVGSVVVGSEEFIYKARRARKVAGGGMRQGGVLAACALWALDNNLPRLHEDHENALCLARGINEIAGLHVSLSKIETNIVYFWVDPKVKKLDEFVRQLADKQIFLQGSYHASAGKVGTCRAVTHVNIAKSDIERVIDEMHTIMTG